MNEFPAHTFYAVTAVAAPERPPLMKDIETEVCVVGGGFAGLWAARSLLARGREVVVLEAGEIAGEASGRNGGFVSAGFAERLSKIIERVGLDQARALYRLSRDGVEIVRSALGAGDTALDAKPGRLNVLRSNDEAGLTEQAEMLARDFGHDVAVWPKERVRAALITDRYYQALYEADAFHLHPLDLARLLAADIELRGGKIFERSRVAEADLDGVRKSVKTATGRVRAFHVVLAGNAALGKSFPRLAGTLLPVRTHVAVTRPLGDLLKKAIRFEGAIADTRRAGDYYRIVGDRLLWGGRITTGTRPPRRLARLMATDIARVYPQLKDAPIEYAWSGTMGYAIHKMPQIGMVQPGVWIASAFGGHGLNTTAMAGDLIAAAIAEQDDRWRLFIPFGLVWAGGLAGRAATQTSYWSMQARDRLDEAQSKRIERDEAAVDAGLAPGIAAHVMRRAKHRVAESPAGRATARTIAGIKRTGRGVYGVLAATGARICAASAAVGRVLAAIIWFVAGVIGFIARLAGKAMEAIAAAIAAILRTAAKGAVLIWQNVVVRAAVLTAAAWTRYIIPALKRLLESANLAGGRARAGTVKLLEHARRSSISLKNEAARKAAAKPDRSDIKMGVKQTAEPATAAVEPGRAGEGPITENAGKPKKKKKKFKAKKDSVEA